MKKRRNKKAILLVLAIMAGALMPGQVAQAEENLPVYVEDESMLYSMPGAEYFAGLEGYEESLDIDEPVPVLLEEEPIVGASSVGYNAAITYENVMAILNQYDPDSAYIFKLQHDQGDNVMTWFGSRGTILDGIDTAIHEETHGSSWSMASSWYSEAIYIQNQKFVNVPYTDVFPSQIAAAHIPQNLRTFRYDTYVGNPTENLASNKYGPYGMLNEYAAYGQGIHVSNRMFKYIMENFPENKQAWSTFVTDGGNNMQAYTEFMYFTLFYLDYAKTNYPDVYREVLANQDYLNAFAITERNFAKEIENFFAYMKEIDKMYGTDWDSPTSTIDFWWDEYALLMNEMKRPQYMDILKKLSPNFVEPYLSIHEKTTGTATVPGNPSGSGVNGNSTGQGTPENKPVINLDETQLQQINDFVERMYTVALGRNSDANGKADWANKLAKKERDGAGIAQGFFMSKEFIGKNHSDNDFVDILYKTFFDRAADAGGKQYWMDKLASGTTRQFVLAGFVNSKEFTTLCDKFGISRGTFVGGPEKGDATESFVLRLYSKVLGRNGDANGVADWVSRIKNKVQTPEEVAKGFFGSKEFINKGLSNEAYVDVLYQTFMDRAADAAGKADWVRKLNGGADRTTVLEGFSRSKEFKKIMESFGL